MNEYTLLFNHKQSNTGLVIQAWDMSEAKAAARQEIKDGWRITAIKVASGEVYPL